MHCYRYCPGSIFAQGTMHEVTKAVFDFITEKPIPPQQEVRVNIFENRLKIQVVYFGEYIGDNWKVFQDGSNPGKQ